jgi:hypothetical protein
MRLEGTLAINTGGVALAGELLNMFGNSVKVIANVGPPPPEGYPQSCQCKFFVPDDLGDPKSVVFQVWRDYLPQALEERSLTPAPEPLVVGKGLEAIQGAYESDLKPVSGQKIVVTP